MRTSYDNDRAPKLLAVDDDSTFLLLTRKSMEKSGFVVSTVTSGEEALEVFEEVQPDIVLLDIQLPGISGIEVCREIRKRMQDSILPILLVTAGGDRDVIREGYNAGATDFLNKPMDWLLFSHRAQYLVRASRGLSELRHSRARLAQAQRIAKLGSFRFDPDSGEIEWSDELYSILHLDPDETDPNSRIFRQMIHSDDREHVEQTIQRALDLAKSFTTEYRLLLRGGEVRHVRLCGEFNQEDIGSKVMSGVVQDVTDHARAMDQLRYLANFDGLTGLTNRRQFKARLDETLRHARDHEQLVALIVLDLDRFKRINDSLGHTAGDQVLQTVADRISELVRSSDCVGRMESEDVSADISRMGGDEFTLLLPRISDPTAAGRVAQRILEAIPPPIEVDGEQVSLRASIGISIFPVDGSDTETLIRCADRAMNHAKSHGGDEFQFYTESLNETSLRRLILEARLRNAMKRNQFHLVYQPKCSLKTGEVVGMEALMRWIEPEIGSISPVEFIPLAEEMGLVSTMGHWALIEACRQNKAWQNAGCAAIPVSVNVSSRQFRDTDLCAVVKAVLEETGLEPQYLELEITESAMIDDEAATTQALFDLRELGIRVSLDDFGTGFSSLSYLRRLPLDTLKIDRSFVMDLPDDSDARGIVEAIVVMAHVLDLHVIAEGVETEEQKAFLRAIRCDEMQGYLFSKPVAPEEFGRFISPSSATDERSQ